jgi:transcriptional regulator with XRE-family HTH domain
MRRQELRLTLSQVAERCGVRLQQIHKYETGQNTITAPMLWHLSRCLNVPAEYFFADLEDHESAEAVGQSPST